MYIKNQSSETSFSDSSGAMPVNCRQFFVVSLPSIIATIALTIAAKTAIATSWRCTLVSYGVPRRPLSCRIGGKFFGKGLAVVCSASGSRSMTVHLPDAESEYFMTSYCPSCTPSPSCATLQVTPCGDQATARSHLKEFGWPNNNNFGLNKCLHPPRENAEQFVASFASRRSVVLAERCQGLPERLVACKPFPELSWQAGSTRFASLADTAIDVNYQWRVRTQHTSARTKHSGHNTKIEVGNACAAVSSDRRLGATTTGKLFAFRTACLSMGWPGIFLACATPRTVSGGSPAPFPYGDGTATREETPGSPSSGCIREAPLATKYTTVPGVSLGILLCHYRYSTPTTRLSADSRTAGLTVSFGGYRRGRAAVLSAAAAGIPVFGYAINSLGVWCISTVLSLLVSRN